MSTQPNHEAEEGLDAIAVVGMTGRFPGAGNIEQFWRNLREGVESIAFFTDEELRASGVPSAVLSRPNYVKAAALLEDIELFDATLFGFSPREAEITNPQHRLFLECAWEALESAGYDSEQYQGRIGVYAGMSMNYYLLNLHSHRDIVASVGDFRLNLGNDKDYLPTWVSYKLNLTGPSINVQTSCSTSLVAVHLACQSLLNGECDMALAGGVSITALHKAGYLYQEGGIASPDGHCRAFDEQARGTLSGNGVGIVVLKRLKDAISDGDSVHAIIKGSGVNNDGSMKVGYTAPSVEGQAEVIAEALALAGVEPETITYVEAHGTGTTLGDPIEVAALTQAFRAHTERKGFCALGSLKTNIGHMDVAAGVGGLIKTVLALKHAQLPPSLHYVRPNPKFDFAKSPFYVNAKLTEWKSNGTPRRAGVSSFGIGGTNAHVVLEEAPAAQPSKPSGRDCLLPLSAKTEQALEAATVNLAAHLKQNPGLNLADVAYTLQVGRRAFNHRRTLVCRDTAGAHDALATLDRKRTATGTRKNPVPPVAFMFPGQGAQHIGMARELYESELTFRAEVDYCSERIKADLRLDLRAVLYADANEAEQASARLEQTFITQPALFVVEYALAKLWMKWGVKPAVMIGHSIGEYVAACLAGVLTLDEALTLVVLRGRLMQQLPPGAMLSVALGEADLRPMLGAELSIAASNGTGRSVVAGSFEAVEVLTQRLTDKNISFKLLRTSHAFHSPMVEPALTPFIQHVRSIALKSPQIPFISNVTGTWITDAEATDPLYWGRHLRQTVRFAEGARELLKQPALIMLEVGPGHTLSTFVGQLEQSVASGNALTTLDQSRQQSQDFASMLTTLGKLWLSGIQVNWPALHSGDRRRIALPTYPFERKRYWIERSNGQRDDRAARLDEASTEAVPVASTSATERNATAKIGDRELEKQNHATPASLQASLPRRFTPAGLRDGRWTPGEAQESREPADATGQIIAQQLRVMAQQLDVLRACDVTLESRVEMEITASAIAAPSVSLPVEEAAETSTSVS